MLSSSFPQMNAWKCIPMLYVHMVSAVPKEYGRRYCLLHSLFELAITIDVCKRMLKHFTERKPCAKCFNEPCWANTVTQVFGKVSFPQVLPSNEAPSCVSCVHGCSHKHLWIFKTFSNPFCLAGQHLEATFYSAWDHEHMRVTRTIKALK